MESRGKCLGEKKHHFVGKHTSRASLPSEEQLRSPSDNSPGLQQVLFGSASA